MNINDLHPDDYSVEPAAPKAARPLNIRDIDPSQLGVAPPSAPLNINDLDPSQLGVAPPSSTEETPQALSAKPVKGEPVSDEYASYRIRPEEVDEVARKRNLSPEDTERLKSVVPYLGAYSQQDPYDGSVGTEGLKVGVGIMGRALWNLPQQAARQVAGLTGGPGVKEAWDELQEMANRRRPDAVQTAETVSALAIQLGLTGGLGALARGAGLLARVGHGVAVGAAQGAAATLGELSTKKTGLNYAMTMGSWTALGGLGSAFPATMTGAMAGLGIGAAAETVGAADDVQAKGLAIGAGIGAFIGIVAKGNAAMTSAAAKHMLEKVTPEVVQKTTQRIAEPEFVAATRSGLEFTKKVALGGKWEGPVAPSQIEALTKEFSDPNSSRLAEILKLHPGLSELPEEQLAKTAAELELQYQAHQQVVLFADYLSHGSRLPYDRTPGWQPKVKTIEEAQTYLSKWAKEGRTSPELDAAYLGFRSGQAAREVSAEWVARTGGRSDWWLSRFARGGMRDPEYLGQLDDRTGTHLSPLSDVIAQQANRARNIHADWAASNSKLLKEMQEAGLDSLTQDQLMLLQKKGPEALLADKSVADKPGLADTMRPALEKYAGLMEQLRVDANELAGQELIPRISGQKAAFYVPNTVVPSVERVAITRTTAEAVGLKPGVRITVEDLAAAKERAPEQFDSLMQQLRYYNQGDSLPTEPADVERLLADATSIFKMRDQVYRVSTNVASPFHGRSGSTPDAFVDTNLVRSAANWQQGVTRDLVLREHLTKALEQRNMLVAAGDYAGAKYVDTWLASIGGAGSSMSTLTAKLSNAATLWAREGAERATSPAVKKFYGAMEQVPVSVSLLTGNIYANMLFRPSSWIKAATAPITSTAPEMLAGGGGWAAAKLLRGYVGAAVELATKRGEAFAALERSGMMPKGMSVEARDALTAGLKRSGWTSAQIRIQGLTDLAAIPMKWAESFNRLVSKHASRDIAAELVQNGEAAHKWLDAMGSSYKSKMQEALVSQNLQAVEALAEQYLTSKTLHHYAPEHMHEWGRVYGRTLGALSTWPSSVVGDISRDFITRGVAGGTLATTRKYLAPFVALYGIQQALNVVTGDGEPSPTARLFFGHGIHHWTPLAEVGRALSPTQSVHVQNVLQSVVAVSNAFQDPTGPGSDKLLKQAQRVGEFYLPGSWLWGSQGWLGGAAGYNLLGEWTPEQQKALDRQRGRGH